jgi:mycoredoxin
MSSSNGKIRMYTTPWCGDCVRAKQVMKSMQVPFEEIDISQDEDAAATVVRVNNGHRSVPTIIFPDGSVLTEPRAPVLAAKLASMQSSS